MRPDEIVIAAIFGVLLVTGAYAFWLLFREQSQLLREQRRK